VSGDEEQDSEGCSSSEEDIEPPTSDNTKKVIEIIQEEASPERINLDKGSTIGDSPLASSRVSKL
jgi:hypothetical protein